MLEAFGPEKNSCSRFSNKKTFSNKFCAKKVQRWQAGKFDKAIFMILCYSQLKKIRELVVTPTKEHRIIILLNIVEIFNKFKKIYMVKYLTLHFLLL